MPVKKLDRENVTRLAVSFAFTIAKIEFGIYSISLQLLTIYIYIPFSAHNLYWYTYGSLRKKLKTFKATCNLIFQLILVCNKNLNKCVYRWHNHIVRFFSGMLHNIPNAFVNQPVAWHDRGLLLSTTLAKHTFWTP